MAIVPGSGAIIKPIFNSQTLGVDSVVVENGGSGYDPEQPPVLIVQNCGIPSRDAVLRPVIKNGRIVAVKVLDSGSGYDPLRVTFDPIIPEDGEEPDEADAKVFLRDDGSLDYIQVTKNGDGYFYDVNAQVLGGGGTNADIRAITKTVTGLSLLNSGRGYETPPFLSITGGGGSGASGGAEVDIKGVVSSSVSISNEGQFYLEAPYLLFVGGGGLGAKGKVTVDQGKIVDIQVTDPGSGYTSPPSIVFTRKVKLKRIARNRQSYNLKLYNLTGITTNIGRADTSIYVSNTAPYPGSGIILLEKEIIRYTGKDANRFTGCTRGLNFRYDQRVVLDAIQNDPDTGVSTYNFNIGDRVIRTQESSSSKIAVVYDWDPVTRELFVIFQVDELAFIDGGSPGEKSPISFDAGVADSSSTFELPHIVIDSEGSVIYRLTEPLSVLQDSAFEDIAELDGAGNGFPDLINTGTSYENQINLDGGDAATLYGIEETVGGQNTTLFVAGDQIKDSSVPLKTATITDASLLDEGVDHKAIIEIKMDTSNPSFYNSIPFVVGETVTGVESLIQATVVSWNPNTSTLVVKDTVPYDTGNPNIGLLYEFSQNSSVVEIRIMNPGQAYTAPPTINIGSSIVTASAVSGLTSDQVTSITVGVGGYGYTTAPSVTFVNNPSDTTGFGAVGQAILGGEKITGQNGASWRVGTINYLTIVRNDEF
jgi:hypothetical protein